MAAVDAGRRADGGTTWESFFHAPKTAPGAGAAPAPSPASVTPCDVARLPHAPSGMLLLPQDFAPPGWNRVNRLVDPRTWPVVRNEDAFQPAALPNTLFANLRDKGGTAGKKLAMPLLTDLGYRLIWLLIATVVGLSTVLGLALPFRHTAALGGPSALPAPLRVLFVAYSAALVGACALAPSAWRYARYCFLLKCTLAEEQPKSDDLGPLITRRTALRCVERYHRPSARGALRWAIRAPVLPRDVVDVTAALMADPQLATDHEVPPSVARRRWQDISAAANDE